MKGRMKAIIMMLATVTALFCGCNHTLPSNYAHPNKGQPIASVELLNNSSWQYTGQEFEVVKVLDHAEIPAFMEKLYDLPTQKSITPPARDFGPNIVRVIYENGDMELFGSWHIEDIKSGEEISGVGSYSFADERFDELFNAYIAG